MKETGERLLVQEARTVEEAVAQARHRYAYRVAVPHLTPRTRLLELGFGEGYGADELSGHVAEYLGLDVSAETQRHAAETHTAGNVRFGLYDGARVPYPDDSFDVVIAFQVVEHIDAVDAWLVEVGRVCRPEGRILLTTPNRLGRVGDGERPWNRFHVREFSPSELDALLSRHFQAVEMFGIAGTDAVNEVERHRVARLRRLSRLDPLRLRERLPAGWIRALSAKVGRRSAAGESLEPGNVTVDSFHHEGNLEESLDLLAVLRP